MAIFCPRLHGSKHALNKYSNSDKGEEGRQEAQKAFHRTTKYCIG